MGKCQSITAKISQSRQRKKDERMAAAVSVSNISTLQRTNSPVLPPASSYPGQNVTSTLGRQSDICNPINVIAVSSYGNLEEAWNALEALYEQQCDPQQLDHDDTIVTLQQMCFTAWNLFTEKGRAFAWGTFLHIIYQRFRNDDLNHEKKIDLLNSIAVFLCEYAKVASEALPLYDALNSNLTRVLGATDQLTLRTLQCKGLHYYYMEKYNESWSLLRSVYIKQKQLDLNIVETFTLMIMVANKLNYLGNTDPFQSCVSEVIDMAVQNETDTNLMLTALRGLTETNTDYESAVAIYDQLILALQQKFGENHQNTLLCMIGKSEFLVKNNRSNQSWDIYKNVCSLAKIDIPHKPKEPIILYFLIGDLCCKVQNNGTCQHVHPFTPEVYELDNN